jgi:hypothetical protein
MLQIYTQAAPIHLGQQRAWAHRPDGRYRRYLVIAARSGQGLLTEPKAGAQVGRRELVILPLKRPS